MNGKERVERGKERRKGGQIRREREEGKERGGEKEGREGIPHFWSKVTPMVQRPASETRSKFYRLCSHDYMAGCVYDLRTKTAG